MGFAGGLMLGLVIFLVVYLQGMRSDLARRIAAVDRKLDALARHLNADLPGATAPDVPDRVVALLREGRKIEAIKAYREATGAGLAEAKDRIEQIARERGLS